MNKGEQDLKTKNAILLLITSIIWGTAFVAQAAGAKIMEPFTFNGIRCLLGGVALLPVIFFNSKFAPKTEEMKGYKKKDLLIGGTLCGLLLFSASSVQQLGMSDTTAGKAGFITAFYIVLIPIFGIFLRKKTTWKVWVAVMIAFIGLYFLCIKGDFTVSRGDIFVFASAIFFSCHVLVIDHFSPKVDGIKMACMQCFITGFLSLPIMLIFETPQIADMKQGWFSLLYAGVFSCSIAYTLQILGQKNVDPVKSSLIMSLESVFSVIGGVIILHETLTGRELLGCILMFSATILAQIPGKVREKKTEAEPCEQNL